ncbi:hypothetical protein LJC60_06235 [Ruminococcaceae bacterium OttesenSCG-928-D13]|nr:hypothetical protein [Ruminococcaceae bacterium OttesenSCG-928-D13]
MNNDLVERYIYAVTRQLPHKLRGDVELELRGLVEDMLEARCGEMPPTEQDLRVVLAELGTPSELAGRYSSDKNQLLIGPPYFASYKLVLQIVMGSMVFGLTVATVVGGVSDGFDVWYRVALTWLGSVMSGLCVGFTWITVMFAQFQRHGVKLDEEGLDALPPVPQNKERIKPIEPVIGIILSAVFMVLLLALPQVLGGWLNEQWIPAFDIAVLRERWLLVLLTGVVSIGVHGFALVEGRRTMRLALVNLAGNLVSVALYIPLFGGGNIVNPAFRQAVGQVFGADVFVANLLQNVNLAFLGVILFALVLDSATTLYEAAKYRR